MRMKLLKIVVVLLLSGSGDARPQETGESRRTETNSMDWRPIVPQAVQEASSSRRSKDLQNIDQSLRTMATQLLNVTSPKEEPPKILDNVINKSNGNQKPVDRNEATPVKEIHVNNGPGGFGRPVNSKFNYFESSHPGQAMAITEEELEKEMSSTRLMTAYKNQPTTTGGISTWILLNPPSTTVKTVEMEPSFETTAKIIVKPTTLMERIGTTERTTEKATIPVSTTIEPSTTKKPVLVTIKKAETKPEKVTEKTVTETISEKPEPVQSTTLKVPQTTINVENKEIGTTKKIPTRTTAKPKTTTVKTAVSKPPKNPRPNQQRPKPPTRRTTVKPDVAKNESTATGKIEKVTFRPVQMITIPKTKTESTEKPMFVTKIKASILMDTQKTTTQALSSSTASLEASTTVKPTTTGNDLVETKPKPVGTKVNNVLKVQLKKPLDEPTKIEIHPIKVNAPVLQIEKVEKITDSKDKETEDETRIDLMKFDFNPELTKINVNTEVSPSTSSTTPSTTTTTTTSTTKRPRHNSKRKKNKTRRRKPTVSTSTSTTVSTSTPSTSTEFELAVEETIENGIQESKIAPESKVAVNSTKTKKKPAATPVSMQIYNFLSREVMPSFGVMSLVGLGLGLASYFLYPFSGTVTRRNYEVEPKYKYNFEEYGGSYGQSEEEVLAKVLQGMTTDDSKYPGSKDYDNYYKYQHYDGAYEATKKNDQRNPSSSPIYRPEKHRNTDYRYSDAQSTPNYYDRPKHSEYVVGSAMPSSVNRKFVVGNVPKEYPNYDEKISALPNPEKLVNSYEPTDGPFNHDVNQNFKFPTGASSYDQIQTARPDETYEVEITPTAVAVEHGPRSLRKKRSLVSLMDVSRRKRDTVIQIIPTKRELEEEEKEDDLSNEILNIIDSALPDDAQKKKNKHNEVDNFDDQSKKEKDEETTRLKESTTSSQKFETSTVSVDTSSVIRESTESSTLSSTSVEIEQTTDGSKTTEQTVEWSESTAKPTEQNGFNLFNFVKKIAEIKLRLGLTLLKHASEGFAKYLGHVQKRINGEE
ncbi:uncharacterized protein LOC108630016 [Ceratina calcarata]|uniref:Uncharacterized protein LOC108630016 n=1 Tax=Ceratina calcarata TaxID=156304 RepID=A0AAJ7S8Q5_9HYME|nr:uncharacterized protein LOC108630016 [Ceratina calcarata]